MFNIISLLSILILASSPPTLKEQPCPRNQPVITYDSKKHVMFLFGGYCSSEKKRLNDLWEFDGTHWREIQTDQAPEPRSGHSMVYDSMKDRLLLFGGKNDEGQLLNDLWSWNGMTWKLLSNRGPTPRQSHRLCFDSSNGTLFLFGGSNQAKESLDDTWIYEQDTWTRDSSAVSPPARLQHALVHDQDREKMILFGGFDRSENGKIIYGDTWEWDKKQGWERKDTNEQLARDHHAMVYDPSLKATLLFGGYNQGYLGDTRSWNGKTWMLRTMEGPSKRAGKPGLIYHSKEKYSLLFGGWDASNQPLMDFWEFHGHDNSWGNHLVKD